jgi:hypothetical protein
VKYSFESGSPTMFVNSIVGAHEFGTWHSISGIGQVVFNTQCYFFLISRACILYIWRGGGHAHC